MVVHVNHPHHHLAVGCTGIAAVGKGIRFVESRIGLEVVGTQRIPMTLTRKLWIFVKVAFLVVRNTVDGWFAAGINFIESVGFE